MVGFRVFDESVLNQTTQDCDGHATFAPPYYDIYVHHAIIALARHPPLSPRPPQSPSLSLPYTIISSALCSVLQHLTSATTFALMAMQLGRACDKYYLFLTIDAKSKNNTQLSSSRTIDLSSTYQEQTCQKPHPLSIPSSWPTSAPPISTP